MRTSIKTSLVVFCLLFLSSRINAQYYASIMPAFYATAGNTGERLTFDIEIGKQWDVFSLGLEFGKTNLAKSNGKDTTWYSEVRSNLNVFQQGKFTNTITIGAGYVLGAQERVLIESTTGIEYSYSKRYHINVFLGEYFFSGKTSASNKGFIGISFVKFFNIK